MKRWRRWSGSPTAAAMVVAAFLASACGAGQGAASAPPASGSPAAGPTTSAPAKASGSSPSPSTTSRGPTALHDGALAAGAYAFQPFAGPDAQGICAGQPACKESPADDSIRVTFTLPDGWAGIGNAVMPSVERYSPPGGGSLIFGRGGWLYSKLCAPISTGPDIPTGTTVDEFVTALVDHPDLDVTSPVDVTLGGYSGKYLELQAPANIATNQDNPKSGECAGYFVWEPGIYAQGPSALWRIWILDVNGVRVVVRADSFPGTSPLIQAQLAAIVDSIQIEP